MFTAKIVFMISLVNDMFQLSETLFLATLCNDNDNDNELFIQTKSNEKHHKGNINNTYKNINIATFVPRRLHLKTSWPLAYNHL